MITSKKPVVLVSSTVYGIEELLERIYTLLTSFGYEVWMSHKGTVPVFSKISAFDNCIRAVENCDLFLGLITPYYGSGIDNEGISITHHELRKAIDLNKIRWLLVHDHVPLARTLLNKLGYGDPHERIKLPFQKNRVFSDLRIIDMYEEAVQLDVHLNERKGNWVQKFRSDEDALLFAAAQFSRYQEVEAFIRENMKDIPKIKNLINRKGKGGLQ